MNWLGTRPTVIAVLGTAMALALTAADAVAAEPPTPLRLGERGHAKILPGEHIDLAVDGLPGATISIGCATWPGDSLLPQLSLSDPDGVAVIRCWESLPTGITI